MSSALPGLAVPVAGGSYGHVTVEELRGMLVDSDFPLINVHIPFEGDLSGTDDPIAFNEITQHLDRLPEDRDALIFLYCRSGSMSATAATELVQLGNTRVVHLQGGFNAWRAVGYEMAVGDPASHVRPAGRSHLEVTLRNR